MRKFLVIYFWGNILDIKTDLESRDINYKAGVYLEHNSEENKEGIKNHKRGKSIKILL